MDGLTRHWLVKSFEDSKVPIEVGNTKIVDNIIQGCVNGLIGKEAGF